MRHQRPRGTRACGMRGTPWAWGCPKPFPQALLHGIAAVTWHPWGGGRQGWLKPNMVAEPGQGGTQAAAAATGKTVVQHYIFIVMHACIQINVVIKGHSLPPTISHYRYGGIPYTDKQTLSGASTYMTSKKNVGLVTQSPQP